MRSCLAEAGESDHPRRPMSVLDKVLTLRPANAVARLGPGSRLPLLSPSELLRALEGSPAALPCVPVRAKAAVPGLLAAARAEDAVLGLACSHPLADRGATERFLAAVKGPPRGRRALAPPVPPGRAGARGQAEAGGPGGAAGGHLPLGGRWASRWCRWTCRRLDAASAVEVVRSLAGPAAGAGAAAGADPARAPREAASWTDTARPLLEGLRKGGVPVRFLRVSAAAFGEEEPGRGAAAPAGGAGHGVRRERDGGRGVAERSLRSLPTFVAAGVRKVDCAAPFERLALAAWPTEARAMVEQKAEAAGMAAGRAARADRGAAPAAGARRAREARGAVLHRGHRDALPAGRVADRAGAPWRGWPRTGATDACGSSRAARRAGRSRGPRRPPGTSVPRRTGCGRRSSTCSASGWRDSPCWISTRARGRWRWRPSRAGRAGRCWWTRTARRWALCRQNTDALGFSAQVEILAQPVARAVEALGKRGERFELIFADPPYAAQGGGDGAGAGGAGRGCWRPGGMLIIEHDKREPAPEAHAGFTRVDQRRFGDTLVSFYRIP